MIDMLNITVQPNI